MPGHAEAPLTSTDSDSWEPPAEVKGDIARALLYMAVRYRGDRANEPALILTDTTGQISSTTNLLGRLTTLLLWHLADPVDARERLRNDRVFEGFQGNRNPFVDRPEWVLAAFLPALSVTPTGNGWRLEWPGEYSAAAIEVSGNMVSWAAVTNAPVQVGRAWTLDLGAADARGFYRLVLR